MFEEIFSLKWKRFKSYATERARNQALEVYQRKFDFLEFREKCEQGKTN